MHLLFVSRLCASSSLWVDLGWLTAGTIKEAMASSSRGRPLHKRAKSVPLSNSEHKKAGLGYSSGEESREFPHRNPEAPNVQSPTLATKPHQPQVCGKVCANSLRHPELFVSWLHCILNVEKDKQNMSK